MDHADRHGFPILAGVDSNAHSELYGPDTNHRGKVFEEFLLGKGLVVENVGMVPTFRATRAQSCIDVTLSKNLGDSVKNWKVDQAYNGSDHATITFDINTNYETIKPSRNWSKTDWKSFTSDLSKAKFYFPENMTDKKVDKLLHKVYTLIDRALDRASPLRPAFQRDPIKPWYTDKLRSIKHRVQIA